MRTLINGGVDKTKLKPILDFYKEYKEGEYDLENNSVFKEFKQKLIDLGEVEDIAIPEELR